MHPFARGSVPFCQPFGSCAVLLEKNRHTGHPGRRPSGPAGWGVQEFFHLESKLSKGFMRCRALWCSYCDAFRAFLLMISTDDVSLQFHEQYEEVHLALCGSK